MSETGPTPERIFQMISAFQTSQALKGALELDVFTALGKDGKTSAALADELGVSAKGMRVLCDYLTIGGLLHKNGDTYESADDASLFLDRNSPAYFGSVGTFLLGSDIFHAYSDMADVVRTGGTLMDGSGTVELDHPVWIDFARSMVPLMKPSADYIGELLAESITADTPLKVLDIAAGHGIFGVVIAEQFANAAIVALDSPLVLEVATENARKAGVADRHSLIEGSAFDADLGDGYDIVLLTNFLHHFSAETCTDLLRKVHASLKDGGKVITLEFVPNDDRITPPEQAAFALTMLATTAEGDAYTFAELESMAAAAGFAGSTVHPVPTAPQTVVVSTK